MAEFDAETYLRLLGERMLQGDDRHDGHRVSPLELPAAALATVGAIEPALALRVIEDHNGAVGARAGERGFPHFGASARRRPRGRLTARQTMVLDHEIAFGGGQLLLRDLQIAESGGGTLRFRWRSDAARPRGRHSHFFGGGGGAFPWGSTPLVITDDQGNRPAVSSGSGSGSDTEWDGELRLDATLSPTTGWLEIEGTRIPVDHRIAPSQTRIEPLEDGDAVARFLHRRLAVLEMPFGMPVELAPAIDALRAAGALAGRERLVDELEAVGAQLPGRHGRPGPRSGAPTASGRRVPQPWRSLLARQGLDDGPSWTRVLGAITPPFDGVQVGFRSVASDSDGFEAEFEVAPNVLQPPAFGELPVAWSARDDRGNHYLGAANGWSGSEESAQGTMRFWPALDPRARALDLVVSAQERRAVVAIPLDHAP